MKHIILLSIFAFTTLLAQNEAAYTITGRKDSRLDATYAATYVSQNFDDDACSYYEGDKGFRRPKIASRRMTVPDGNYSLKLPITLTKEENKCSYRFAGLELYMRRKYDNELSSIHTILSDKKEVSPIYWKTKGGEMWDKYPDTPPYLQTDKKYFRIAKESTFLCKTFWFEKGRYADAHSQFHCTMQIDDDVNRTLYYQKDPLIYSFSHPEFGVDAIENETMRIDILVDEKNCKMMENRRIVPDNFRELEKPNLFQKLF
ncbi:MAG: hypothetical protein AB7S65_13140 [Sulfuricurvum sp.]